MPAFTTHLLSLLENHLYRGWPCEFRRFMLLVTLSLAYHRFPSPLYIHGTPESPTLHLPIILHHCKPYSALVSPTRCSARFVLCCTGPRLGTLHACRSRCAARP